jgi:Uma2 family endonuclease
MDADEFLAWAQTQPGRHELVQGQVSTMSAEQAQHALVKGEIYAYLRQGVRERNLPCQVFVDGMALRVSRDTVYEPDACVRYGEPVDPKALAVDDPLVVVEVVSPSTSRRDSGAKLADYFAMPSVRHYLIVDCDRRVVTHHRREAGRIETAIISRGDLTLDPPGLVLAVQDLFPAQTVRT